MQVGADPTLQDEYSRTALDYACNLDDEVDTRALQALLSYPSAIDVNYQGPGWWSTSLNFAINRKRPQHVKMLVNAGASVTLKTQNGFTPAGLAKHMGLQGLETLLGHA